MGLSAPTPWWITRTTAVIVLVAPVLLPPTAAVASPPTSPSTSQTPPALPYRQARWVPGESSHDLPLPVPVALLRPFVAPMTRWGPGHRGVDLAASPGQPITAPADGVVSFTGHVVDRGVVTLTHPDGTRSSFEPVDAVVDVGATVSRGETVAVLQEGVPHCAAVPCLHWGVRRGTNYVDPLGLLAADGPTVLLP